MPLKNTGLMDSMKLKAVSTCVATCALLSLLPGEVVAQDAAFRKLTTDQIRATLSGKFATDDAHWLHHYLPDGRLVSVERGRENRGRWLVKNSQLCLVRLEKTPEPECLDIYAHGSEIEYRDKGQVIAAGHIRKRQSTID